MKKFDFTNQLAPQDMLKIIMRDKNLSKEEALKYAINEQIAKRIIDTRWGAIALPIWGHDDPERKWMKLDIPFFETDLSEKQLQLITLVKKYEETDTITAISYFLLFTMESLGYHI